ncbi:MAG: PD-(D/E)XK nuclease family protein, partial [Proteobacteria bacterium]|nr:PD-(D/E)XK nuclease family protein [Pseudomonadota bacterium]
PSPSQGEGEYERESRENMSLLNQFMKRIKKFESASDDKSVKAFLAELNMEIDSGEQGSLSPDIESGPEAIKIMTIHGSKGLEFKYVFIANMVDKRFPTIERHEQILIPDALIKEILPEGDIHLEEERRLFYVAMTRAKNDLYFSWAPDYGGARKKKPSRFLKEINLSKEETADKKAHSSAADGSISNFQFPISKQIPNPKLQTAGEIKEENLIMPNYFSYTQLAAFSNCPYQYRFAHILRVPMTGKPVFSFGKTMHSVLQKIFELVNEKKGMGQGDLFSLTPQPPLPAGRGGGDSSSAPRRAAASAKQYMGSIENSPPSCLGGAGGGINISLEEILKLYEQSWIDDWYESGAQKQEYKKKGREILKEFYAKHHDSWPNAAYLEKGFNIKLRGTRKHENTKTRKHENTKTQKHENTKTQKHENIGTTAVGGEVYTVRGVIDRIDEEDGKLKIVDYKTGSPKDKLTFNEKEQLLIYQMAVSEIFRQEISSLAFYYLNNNSEVEFLGTEEELGKVKDKILNIIQDIKKGEFPAKPSQLCKFCDFYSICEFRKS